MNRIDSTLAKLKASGKKVLSPYITAGDPTPDCTVSLMHALVKAGADILEIGIPFSDPMAEGPVIQAAMERALAQGMTCEKVLAIIASFRKQDQTTPIIVMGYANPIAIYGYERFAQDAIASGVDGTIIVDIPPEESDAILPLWRQAGLYTIYLCSPTTSDERMQRINACANGYLYYVSLKGVTGAGSFNLDEVKQRYQQRKKQTQLPLMIGFGIKTASMAAEVAQFADGVIVGAALVNTIYESYSKQEDYIHSGAALITAMRQAMDQLQVTS